MRNLLIALLALAAGSLTAVATIPRDRPVPGPPPAAADKGGSVWGADYFPNVPLTTHDGRSVRFFDDLIKDKVVAINFMYTYCPDTCPVETARLLQVARLLGDRLGRDVFFYSISVDPEHDTREVLEAFVDSWGIPDGWKFLTGDRRDIVLLRERLGMRIDDVESGDLADHTVSLLLGNQKTGRWMRRSPFENAHVLALQLGSWLHGWKLPSEKRLDYAQAPELRTISDGEYIFRNQCSACHTIGGGDVWEVAARRLGPDLLDVTRRRDRAWLERWIAEPDAMLEEGEPLATALFEAWDEMPMPNLRLTEKDVASLLRYIEEESRRVARFRAARLGGHAEHGRYGEAAGHAGHGPQHADHGRQGEHAEHAAHAGAP